MDSREAYSVNVQANYRYYCFHVHNQAFLEGRGDMQWIPSKFHRFLCDTVQDFIERDTDKAFEILILNTPPQHGKSTTITETLPSWYLMRNPDKNVIEVSYGDDLAERFGKRNLEKVKEFGKYFGVSVDKRKATAREFQLSKHRGRMISKGFGSGLTGHTGNLIVIDDPIKNREQADSERQRDAIWDEFRDSIVTRTSAGAKIILIMTRWHEDDLAGRIMAEMSDKATMINLPCECDEEDDPLGREIGDALCPEIGKGNEWLADFKATHTSEQGLRSWNALYQGRPTAKEGNMLHRDWWEYYEVSDYEMGKMRFDTMIMSVDAAFKDEKQNDYVAIGVWAKKGARIYLVDLVNEHLNFTNTVRKIKVMKARYPQISSVLIEDKANGTAIIQVLKDEIFGITAVRPDASKEARVNAVSFLIEAGNVYLPKDKKFTWEFVEQCSQFPNGKHDDMVDCMSQALSRLMRAKGFQRIVKKLNKSDKYFHVPDNKPVNTGKGSIINVI